MKKSLNTLSETLKSRGHINASISIDDLIKTLDNLKRDCHTKVAEESAIDNIKLFMDSLKSKKKTTEPNESELEKWNKIIKDYDKIPYRAEKFHEISDSIFKKILSPFMKKKKDLETATSTLTDEDKSTASDLLSSQLGAKAADIPKLIKQANDRAKIYLKNNDINKIGIPNNHVDEYAMKSHIAAKQFEDLALNKLALSEQVEAQGFWSKLLSGDQAKEAARLAGKKPGFWERSMPIFGLLFSLPLALKNIHEAYINGKKIAEELPLDKYNINKSAALTGNPLLLSSLISSIKDAIEENKNNPENLYELLEIVKTISAYWLDLIFAITNTLMAIVDGLELVAVSIDGALPIGDVVGGFFGFFVAMGLMGVEFASEHYVVKYWKKQTEKIKHIAEEKIVALGGVVETGNADEPETFPTDQPMAGPSTVPSKSPEENVQSFMDSLKAKPVTA